MKIITNDDELRVTLNEIDSNLLSVENYLKSCKHKDKMHFPPTIIKNAFLYRKDFEFLNNSILSSNISYQLMFVDFLRWNYKRFNFYGVVADMLIKNAVFIYANILESVLKVHLKGICGKQSFKVKVEKLCQFGIIEEALKIEIIAIWDLRNKIHLYLLEKSEYYEEYNAETANNCKTSFYKLIGCLAKPENIVLINKYKK